MMADHLTLTVTGMTCGGCERAVQRAVGLVPGVSEVAASHSANEVRVTFDPERTSRAQIVEKIGALGYHVAADTAA